jgi:peroxiredoxin
LVNLKNKLGDSFEVIAIEAQEYSNEESLKYIKEYGINYHIIPGESHADFYAYLQEKYAWTGIIPLTIVISKAGDVLAFELGAKSYSLSGLMKAALLRE